MECLVCQKELIGQQRKYCSKKCGEVIYNASESKRNIEKSLEKYKDIPDIPTCRICGQKGTNLITHINVKHGMNKDEYCREFKCDLNALWHSSYRKKLKLFEGGEKNPAYRHGGKLSPYSKNYIHYEGEDKRKEIIKKASENRSYTTRVEYFLEEAQCNWDLATFLLKERQATFSKEKCVEKYGEKEGIKRWKERQEKWQDTLNSKSDEEKKRINGLKINGSVNYSKASQKLFWKVYSKICNSYKKIFFAQLDGKGNIDSSGKNHEYILELKKEKYCRPDFLVEDIKKIIEFDGSYWHDSVKGKGKGEKELERERLIKNEGYKILHVKEKDFYVNEDEVVKKCLEFLNERDL